MNERWGQKTRPGTCQLSWTRTRSLFPRKNKSKGKNGNRARPNLDAIVSKQRVEKKELKKVSDLKKTSKFDACQDHGVSRGTGPSPAKGKSKKGNQPDRATFQRSRRKKKEKKKNKEKEMASLP